jgi:hypothetical protein
MIALTKEQIQALGNPEKTLPRLTNPQTKETFVLVPLEEYNRLTEDDDSWTNAEREQLRWEACQTLDSFGKEE